MVLTPGVNLSWGQTVTKADAPWVLCGETETDLTDQILRAATEPVKKSAGNFTFIKVAQVSYQYSFMSCEWSVGIMITSESDEGVFHTRTTTVQFNDEFLVLCDELRLEHSIYNGILRILLSEFERELAIRLTLQAMKILKMGEAKEHTAISNYARALPGVQDLALNPCDGTCEHRTYIPGDKYRIYDLVIHLNDTHQWTRHRIADWLETLDNDLSFTDPVVSPQFPYIRRESVGRN